LDDPLLLTLLTALIADKNYESSEIPRLQFCAFTLCRRFTAAQENAECTQSTAQMGLIVTGAERDIYGGCLLGR
jgi:hypothetical protein